MLFRSQLRGGIVAKAVPRLPCRALGNAKSGAQLLNLRRVHHARMIVLVPGKRQAIALDRIGDEQGRAIVAGAVEGLDQRLDAMAAQVGHERGQRLVVKAVEQLRSEEHTSELQSLMRISYAVFCLKKKNHRRN